MINLPEEYEKEMRSLLGAEFEEYKKIYEQPVRQGLRFNPYKLTKPVWEEIMPFEKEEIPWVENGYYIHGEEKEENPARHPYYFAGLYYLQEPSAMTPASRLEIQPYDKVLDLCAAPGGKATEMAGRLQGKGLLLANDLSNSRAKALLKNLELTGVPNFYVTSEEPAKLVKNFPEFFDKILIDAPCSGEGMFHKEPKMAEYWLEKSPDYYAKIQKELIIQGAQMLKPGGKMLYSTCTFSKKENEETIAYLLEQRDDMEVLAPLGYEGFSQGFSLEGKSEEINRQLKKCVRIFPHKMPGEGHFLALIQKKGNGEKSIPRKTAAAKKEEKLDDCVEEFLKAVSFDFSEGKIKKEKDKVYFLPGDGNMPKLRYLRTGLYLGEIRKNRFEPSQALAMALSPKTFASCVLLSSKDIRTVKYLKGETIDVADLKPAKEKGWQLVCVDGFSLGFGKLDRGILKNKYYPGWRMQ